MYVSININNTYISNVDVYYRTMTHTYFDIDTYIYIYMLKSSAHLSSNYRRKFGSKTSDNMDRWKGHSQEETKGTWRKSEGRREEMEKVREKMQVRCAKR